MATATEKKKIGEHTYETHLVDGVSGRRAFHRFIRLMKASAGRSANGEPDFFDASEEDIEFFYDLLAPLTFVSGGGYAAGQAPLLSDVFSEHFRHNYIEMSQWLAWAVGVNFGDFTATSKPSS